MKRWLTAVLSLCLSSVALASMSPTDIINPSGDELLGTLAVKSPKEPDSAHPRLVPFKIQTPTGTQIANVAGDNRMTEGTYNLDLSNVGTSFTSELVGVAVHKQQTTTVAVSGFRLDWNSSVFQIDVGPEVMLNVSGTSGHGEQFAASTGWVFPNGRSVLATLDSQISIVPDKFPMFQTIPLTMNAGDVVEAKQIYPDLRAQLTLVPPTRAFPESSRNGCARNQVNPFEIVLHSVAGARRFHMGSGVFDNGRMDNSGVIGLLSRQVIDVPANALSRFFPSADGKTLLNYELVVNNTYMPLQMATGESKTLEIKRLDVNDVLVTREDGTKVYYPGTFEVQFEDPTTHAMTLLSVPTYQNRCDYPTGVTRFATKTGLDVVPGHYIVTVYYTTELGAQKQVFDLNL